MSLQGIRSPVLKRLKTSPKERYRRNMQDSKVVLSLLAHPDDAEFMCVGTLALLKQKGWQVHLATMTAGDCGSADLGCVPNASEIFVNDSKRNL